MPTLTDLADDLGVALADVNTIATWLRAHDDRHALVGDALYAEVRDVLDPDGQRTAHAHTCPSCGRWPGPYRFLVGWHPCGCGGHLTSYCRPDTGGCGFEQFDPLLDPDTCRDAGFGFFASRTP